LSTTYLDNLLNRDCYTAICIKVHYDGRIKAQNHVQCFRDCLRSLNTGE